MNLRDVVTFINTAYVMTSTEDIVVGGAESVALVALRAKSLGSKLAIARRVNDTTPFSIITAHVVEIIQLTNAYVLTVRNESIDGETLAVHLRKAKQSERAGWQDAWNDVEDLDDVMEAALEETVRNEPVYVTTPQSQQHTFQHAVVSALDFTTNVFEPIGVLVERADLPLLALGLDAETQSDMYRFATMSRLEEASERAGRMQSVGSNWPVRGTDANDAARRALYKAARVFYIRTGKSVWV